MLRQLLSSPDSPALHFGVLSAAMACGGAFLLYRANASQKLLSGLSLCGVCGERIAQELVLLVLPVHIAPFNADQCLPMPTCLTVFSFHHVQQIWNAFPPSTVLPR
jgi:hypothetical protein